MIALVLCLATFAITAAVIARRERKSALFWQSTANELSKLCEGYAENLDRAVKGWNEAAQNSRDLLLLIPQHNAAQPRTEWKS